MSKFEKLTGRMKKYISEHGVEKLKKVREIDQTWRDIAGNFNEKWEDAESTPVDYTTFRLWTKKLNPDWREEGDGKTWVTPKRVEYVRERLDVPNEELAEETGLTKYVIHVIKEAKRHNFYRSEDNLT